MLSIENVRSALWPHRGAARRHGVGRGRRNRHRSAPMALGQRPCCTPFPACSRSAGTIRFEGEPHRPPLPARMGGWRWHLPSAGRRQLFRAGVGERQSRLGASSRRDDDWPTSAASSAHHFPSVPGVSNRVARTLSGGEQQMFAIGRALMAKPRLRCWTSPPWGWRR